MSYRFFLMTWSIAPALTYAVNAEEPGELKDAPYHWEHFTAETIERQLAIALRRDWRDYMAACNKLFE